MQIFNCPNMREISLEFSRQENDSTDLTTMADGLGRNCPRLQNIHIASIRLSHSVVLALTAAGLRFVKWLHAHETLSSFFAYTLLSLDLHVYILTNNLELLNYK